MPQFFINRPNFAWVIAIFITLAGVLVIPSLPVSQFPDVAPPQITITATYPGASAQTVADSVTSPIEEELNGAKNLLYYDSLSSSTGDAEINVTFQPGTDPGLAQVDVQNRLKNAESRLPPSVIQQGITVEQANAGFLMLFTLSFKNDHTSNNVVSLADYAVRNVNNEIRRIDGVGKVIFFAASPAMRIWVDPDKLTRYGLTIQDVNSAISAQNVQIPAGSFGARPSDADQEFTATIAIQGMLSTPVQFGNIVLRANQDGQDVKLKDVARLEIGQQNYNYGVNDNGKTAVATAIQLAPGANALKTAQAVKTRLKELSANFPPEIQYSVPYDTSTFVSVAIEKVIHTLFEAVVLVFLVMLLFLQNIRYTLVPTIVVPVSLMGTLAAMYAIGFSVNMMTMFGMVLAIGILVDDAIVVVENVERIMNEEGLLPKQATIKAMQQVSGAIVGITLALASVFLPLAFMTGSVGVIYRQFSVSLVVSILLSGFLALTLTPALCALLLKPIEAGHEHGKKGVFGWFNRHFANVTDRFVFINSKLVKRAGRCMLVYLGIVAIFGLIYKNLPEAFVPVEDQGYYIVDIKLPVGATYSRTKLLIEELQKYQRSRNATENAVFIMGYSFSGSGQNVAVGFPTLKDWKERSNDESATAEADALNTHFIDYQDGTAMAINPPPIDGLSNAGGFSMRLEDRGSMGRETLIKVKNMLLAKANASPIIAYAEMEGLEDSPQLRVKIDRQKAEALGVSFSSISNVISSAYGSSTINDFTDRGRLQRVVVQADADSRLTPQGLMELQVPGRNGGLVPVNAFATMVWETGPVQVARYNGYQSIRITGDAAPGHSSGEAMVEMEKIVASLPEGFTAEWTGLSYQEKAAGSQAPFLFALSFLTVFLLLVALYESWAIPASVMLIVPLGAIGTVLAANIAGLPNDVYFKIGLITIIGLATKNAILIIEFAKDLSERGYSLVDASLEAARLRFRPVVMTSMAFILGVVPLAIATGAGAASQRSIGTGVLGGMFTATLLGVIFVPVFFVWICSVVKKSAKASDKSVSTEAQTSGN
ncbi:multidrug efflux RND transporter permease subunit [Salmonella enterica]|nr:multidrug efflux RND transporter permease subunit [Salmonella enterica]